MSVIRYIKEIFEEKNSEPVILPFLAKIFLFNAPGYKKSFFLVGSSGLVYSYILSLLYFSYSLIDFLFTTFFFLLSTFFYVFYLYLLFDNFYKKRAFLNGFLNQSMFFLTLLLFRYEFSFIFLGLIYSLNYYTICLVTGKQGLKALFSPWIYLFVALALFKLFLSYPLLESSFYFKISAILLFGFSSFFLIYLVERIFRLSYPYSPISFFSAYINREKVVLPEGVEILATFRKLIFRNKQSNKMSTTIGIPWLHPGPLANIGGGSLSRKTIEWLNSEEFGHGFFWHAPCSHEEDPTDPDVFRKLTKEGSKNYYSKISKLYKVEKNPFKVYGHRFGDKYLVFIEGDADDYDISIFRELEKKLDRKIIFVDSHQNSPLIRSTPLSSYEEKTDILRECVIDLVSKLENTDQYKFKSSSYVSDNYEYMVLALEVDDEKYLHITFDTDGLHREFRNKLWKIEKNLSFDHVSLITTDTHESFYSIFSQENIDISNLVRVSRKIMDRLEKSKIGLYERKEKTKVLGKHYYLIETSAKWMIYMFPFSIILQHLLLFSLFL